MMISEQQTGEIKEDDGILGEHRAGFEMTAHSSQRFVVWSSVSPRDLTAGEYWRRCLEPVGGVEVTGWGFPNREANDQTAPWSAVEAAGGWRELFENATAQTEGGGPSERYASGIVHSVFLLPCVTILSSNPSFQDLCAKIRPNVPLPRGAGTD